MYRLVAYFIVRCVARQRDVEHTKVNHGAPREGEARDGDPLVFERVLQVEGSQESVVGRVQDVQEEKGEADQEHGLVYGAHVSSQLAQGEVGVPQSLQP